MPSIIATLSNSYDLITNKTKAYLPSAHAVRTTASLATNLTAIGGSVASLLPQKANHIVAPVLGSISFTALQVVYRIDNDQLRSKIEKHKVQYEILYELLPNKNKKRQQYAVSQEKIDPKQFGVNPKAKKDVASTWSNILLALSAGGIAGYMSFSEIDNWNTATEKGLGVATVTAFMLSSSAAVAEEHMKKVNLEKIDKEYKNKIKAIKSFFYYKKAYNKLNDYHDRLLESKLKPKLIG